MSLEAVERQLTAKLADGSLKKPVVSVALDQARSQFVFVTGEVRQAGTYPLLGRTTGARDTAQGRRADADGRNGGHRNPGRTDGWEVS